MVRTPILLLIMATIAIFGLMVAPPCAADNSMNNRHSLCGDQALTTGYYALVMQKDCNLVLYDKGQIIWETNTSGQGIDCCLTLHDNGNLVIHDQDRNREIWQSGTNGRVGSYVLVLQQDRNVVVYGPGVWETHTAVGHNAAASVGAAAEQVIISAAAGAMVK